MELFNIKRGRWLLLPLLVLACVFPCIHGTPAAGAAAADETCEFSAEEAAPAREDELGRQRSQHRQKNPPPVSSKTQKVSNAASKTTNLRPAGFVHIYTHLFERHNGLGRSLLI